MSGNNKEEWDKFINGGSSHYNFSYRQHRELNQMPIFSSPIPLPPPSTSLNVPKSRAKNNKTQKIELPALKDAVSGLKNRALKGGSRHRKRQRMRTHRTRK
jgi:hypothetical protein